jgi:hypothetical protein
MMKRTTIYALIIGLIFAFTQVARGQQSGAVQPPPSGAVAQNSSGGPSASDVANANNPIAPMNALYFHVSDGNSQYAGYGEMDPRRPPHR